MLEDFYGYDVVEMKWSAFNGDTGKATSGVYYTFNKPSYGVTWSCRFHPTDWFHEVGCPHMEWSVEDLRKALAGKKKFEQSIVF